MNLRNKLVKNLAFVLFTLSIGFIACEKDDDYTAQLIQKEIEDREAYLEADSVTTAPTASGLYYIEIKEGTGVQATAGDIVKVDYQGQFLNGQIFDASMPDGTPIEFTLGVGQVIKGWDEAIALMKEGGSAKLIIPSDLAYGATGSGSIPPYTTLVFYVNLIDVK